MNQKPLPRIPWHVILLRRCASEVLLFGTESAWRMPVVEIPVHCRTAHTLNAQAKTLWNLDILSLYSLPNSNDSTPRYHLAEAMEPNAEPPHRAAWIPISTVVPSHFADASDFTALKACLERTATGSTPEHPQPFESIGWFAVAKEMVRKSAERCSAVPSGSFAQFNASSSFSLVRFETDDRAIWFKAVGEPNLREFGLTLLLSARLPEFTPRLLLTEPLWNAWTMLETTGSPLSQASEVSIWCRTARDLARMQIASTPFSKEFLASDARDIRAAALLGELQPFFEVIQTFMRDQPAGTQRALPSCELRQLELDLRDALLGLLSENIPDTLGHLDLNPDNIIVDASGAVFLDWAEGAVGHPFLSFSFLMEFFAHRFAEGKPLVIQSYLGEWAKAGLARDVEPTLTTCRLLAIFAHAVSTDAWRDPQRCADPTVAGYYRSLTRRMKKYSDSMRSGVFDATGVLS